MVSWFAAVNWLSLQVFKTKILNSNRLAKSYYAKLRELGLTSQLACSACKTVSAAYKAEKSKNHNTLIKFSKSVIPIVWRRDFNRSKKGLTLWSEKITICDTRAIPETGWRDSKIKRVGQQWYLLLCYEIDAPEPKAEGSIVGVDMGIKRMLVATNSRNSKPFFFHGGELNHRRACIRRTRAAIQAVGTKSSRRLLRRLSGNEAAVTAHLTHVASKALVSYAIDVDARRIVVEDLNNIRDASLSKGKDLHSKIHRWPYAGMRVKNRVQSCSGWYCVGNGEPEEYKQVLSKVWTCFGGKPKRFALLLSKM